MPTLPQQPTEAAHRSLQINIDSEEDAKAVIQHLQAIKNRYDILERSGLIDSIEFCIAAPIRRVVDADLTGAIRWCRTWLRSVAPFEGNVHFELPHYVPGPVRAAKPQSVPITLTPVPASAEPLAAKPGDTPLPAATKPPPHVKPKRPVSADTAAG